jgi:predicted NodU family carbamoyl transferase
MAELSDRLQGTTRQLIAGCLATCLPGLENRPLSFVDHHRAHAYSSTDPDFPSDSLTVVVDGNGDGVSTTIFHRSADETKLVASFAEEMSIGHMYTAVTRHLGFGPFDQYKVMGLAPYGISSKYRSLFDAYVSFVDGCLAVDRQSLMESIREVTTQRDAGDVLSQVHKDLAASLQDATERLLIEIVSYYTRLTGCFNVVVAGGVSQNSSAIGKVAVLGEVKSVYVPPWSADAGATLGAALGDVVKVDQAGTDRGRLQAALGLNISVEDAEEAVSLAGPWMSSVHCATDHELASSCAEMLAQGDVLAFARGRTEFGPRALGNRSLFAEACNESTRAKLNSMIKMREEFRPFAPIVRDVDFDKFFVRPVADISMDHMECVVSVRKEWQPKLAAVTHVDGSARVQVIRQTTDAFLWAVLEILDLRSGVGVAINTSFNHASEPIVNTAIDAVQTFLACDVDALLLNEKLFTRARILSGAAYTVGRRSGSQVPATAIERQTITDMGDLAQLTKTRWKQREIDIWPAIV